MPDWIPESLAKILRETPALSRAYLVGGCVRDWLLGQPNKDFDIEVFGIDEEQLIAALKPWGRTDLVGRSFGVIKLTTRVGETFDFSLPRAALKQKGACSIHRRSFAPVAKALGLLPEQRGFDFGPRTERE